MKHKHIRQFDTGAVMDLEIELVLSRAGSVLMNKNCFRVQDFYTDLILNTFLLPFHNIDKVLQNITQTVSKDSVGHGK